ncbi:NUDIX domain-containing protein [Streptomyces sp. NPDC056549]|uniref:NUDIX domain-containing protein n=1 Tax=Streptomyces sp. NPDC056549 TaxID=3345864 RepID=UPI0036CDB9BB
MIERVRAVLATADGTMLVIRRTKPGIPEYWVLPGGGVEPSEPFSSCLCGVKGQVNRGAQRDEASGRCDGVFYAPRIVRGASPGPVLWCGRRPA